MPGLNRNILSTPVDEDSGYYHHPTTRKITCDDDTYAPVSRVGQTYYLPQVRTGRVTTAPCASPGTSTTATTGAFAATPAHVVHARYLHADRERMRRKFPTLHIPDTWLCSGCLQGRMIRNAKPSKTRPKATRRGERVYMDILVTRTTAAHSDGWKYALVLIDEYSNYMFTYPMAHKTDTYTRLCEFLASMRAENVHVGTICADSDPNFKDVRVRDLLRTHKFNGGAQPVHLELSSPSNQYQNGPAESAIRTLKHRGAAALASAKLGPKYFMYAILAASYVNNYTPSAVNPSTLRNGVRVHVTTAIIIAIATHSRTGSMSARHDVPSRTMYSVVASCPRCLRRKQRIQASQRCPAGDNRFFHMRGSLTSRVSGLYATYLQSKKSEEIQNNAQFGPTSPSLRLRLWTRMVRRCLGLLSKLRIRGPPSRAH